MDTANGPDFDPVILGRISGLFGVKGWVKIYSYTEPREALLGYGPWWISDTDGWRPIAVAEGQRHGKTVIVRIDGIDDRDQAAALLEREIAVAKEALPAPADGQYYWRDLEGLDVIHRDGRSLGKVAYVMETGANDVLVTKGDREYLIPFVVDEVILDVDFARGVINVDWEWD